MNLAPQQPVPPPRAASLSSHQLIPQVCCSLQRGPLSPWLLHPWPCPLLPEASALHWGYSSVRLPSCGGPPHRHTHGFWHLLVCSHLSPISPVPPTLRPGRMFPPAPLNSEPHVLGSCTPSPSPPPPANLQLGCALIQQTRVPRMEISTCPNWTVSSRAPTTAWHQIMTTWLRGLLSTIESCRVGLLSSFQYATSRS